MSITMFTGRPGTGKTYCLTREVFKLLKRGELIYSNYHFNHKLIEELLPKHAKGNTKNIKYWTRLNQLFNVKNGTIVIDEAHVYMNARRWKGLPEEMERTLAQHRKEGLHIMGTVQAVQRVDVLFRELIDFWYVCQNRPGFFVRWEFDLDQDKQKKYPLTKRWILKRKKFYNMYDTLEKIVPDI